MFAHSQAPIRIGLGGGGTDLPIWTKNKPGRCLSLAIATYTHAVAITREDKQVVAAYSQLDRARCVTEIANGLVRESALAQGFEDGFEIHTLSEVSSRGSGLGVSSSIAVALAACFMRLRLIELEASIGRPPAPVAPIVLAKVASDVEIERLRRAIGRQDHMAAACGGLRLYRFDDPTSLLIERDFSEADATWVAEHLLIVQLPDGHDAHSILSSVPDAGCLQVAYDAVGVVERAIAERNLFSLGEALRMGHASKRAIPGATPASVAAAVDTVENLRGVFGAKVAGAGGGGHLVVAFDGQDSTLAHVRTVLGLPARGVKPDFYGVRSDGWP